MTNYLPKILITGGNGQLAKALQHHALAKQFILQIYSHQLFDITQPQMIEKIIAREQPDFIINTAAYTAVDKAEYESEQALFVNYYGAKNLAIACEKYHIPLLHLSTDYVFDGQQIKAYVEHDPINPLNIYGKSKCLGEKSIREACEQHIILRVSGVFSEYGNNFVKTILRLAQEKNELRIVADQITCLTYASDIALVLFKLIQIKNHWGTYHYCNSDALSWYDFAVNILEIAAPHYHFAVKKIQAITGDEYISAAKRPRYSVLNCKRIEQIFHLSQVSWRAGISQTINHLVQHATLSTA